MWVRLKAIKQIEIRGVPTRHFPGEWVDVGKYDALSWLAAGDADRPDIPNLSLFPGCGVVRRGAQTSLAQQLLLSIEVTEGKPALAYNRTLFWDTSIRLRPELVYSGFRFLDQWEIALPLRSYTSLASEHITSQRERARALETLRDLRVLLYEPRLMFLKRCAATRQLLEAWREELSFFSNECSAFLVALYRIKPVVLALPVEWAG